MTRKNIDIYNTNISRRWDYMLNRKVNHFKFGYGFIYELEEEKVVVQFDMGDRKTFKYPDSFEQFMEFDNKVLQDETMEKIKLKKEHKSTELEVIVNRIDPQYSEIEKNLSNHKKNSSHVKHIITKEMAEISYEFAKKVYQDEIGLGDAKKEVEKLSGMNQSSAQDYTMDFRAMMEGREYRRAMKNADTKLFLERIREDFGERYFIKAIEATWKHIKYYEEQAKVNMRGKRVLLEKMVGDLEYK